MSISEIHCQFLWPRVIPAQAGIQETRHQDWMPAFAGMTFYWHQTYETDI
jgi:hypothetical protein